MLPYTVQDMGENTSFIEITNTKAGLSFTESAIHEAK